MFRRSFKESFSLVCIVLCIAAALQGCGTTQSFKEHDPIAIVRGGVDTNVYPAAQQHTVGRDIPAVPVLNPPLVLKIWIKDHVNSDGDFVLGHTAFIRITDSYWMIEHPGREHPPDTVHLVPVSEDRTKPGGETVGK